MKKNESSTQSSTNLLKTSGLSLEEYKELIGKEEYRRQYLKTYARTVYSIKIDRRNSGMEYTNSKEDLDKIKEKYKNGVTNDILKEWLF